MSLSDKLNLPFWLDHRIGNEYEMRNRDGSIEACLVVYYPLESEEPTALIEIPKMGYNDFREVPIRFLNKIK